MHTFTLEPMGEVRGRIPFFKLVIDGHCPFDAFCDQIQREGHQAKLTISTFTIMNQVSNLQRLPKEIVRDITPAREGVREYEIKRGALRFYLIKFKGHIVILGGKKGTQQKDIARFRSLKKSYLNSI